ncbi:MAG: AGE family epimerase/isomerase, partial [Thermoguttaceae bacterium]
AGANLLTDQPLLKAMAAASTITGNDNYRQFADRYIDWYLANLVDERGFLWWGWHRHYDVYQDRMLGHMGNPHEIHAIHSIAWDQLWQVRPEAVRREIEAIWQWHVIDKTTGEVNRHGDGQRGCDFAMSAGACACAFAFLHQKTDDPVWLDRARLLANYYWDRRNPATGLFPDRPNAGADRFDGSHFVTADTGLYCHALLKCYELTGDALFKNQALAYLKAYRKYGYDPATGQFWGSLRLDGTPVAGPRLLPGANGQADYGVYEPRGYLDLWQPYVAGYEHPLPTAQVYPFAFSVTGDPSMIDTAGLFARLVETNLPPRGCLNESWYRDYAEHWAPQGTYAGHYGQTVSFFLHLHLLTGDPRYLQLARATADGAIARLYHNGLFRGHPAKPYYEAVDGVGYLLYSLLQLDQVTLYPEQALSQKKILVGSGARQVLLPLDNW